MEEFEKIVLIRTILSFVEDIQKGKSAPGPVGDVPPKSQPFITGDSRLRFGFELVSSPPRLCGCGKREAVSTSA